MGFVSAAEFVRKFARFRDDSHAEPVFITHHGRETHVLCDVATWRYLTDGTGEASRAPKGAPETAMFGLAEWSDAGVLACDEDLTIVFANRVSHGLAHVAHGSLVGRRLTVALPRISGGIIEAQARQTLVHGEHNLIDIASPFVEGAWLRVQFFLFNGRLVISLRDVSLEVERNLKANINEALMSAIELHGDLSCIHVSVRGTIDRIDGHLPHIMGLTADRLAGIYLTDLIAVADKPRFRDALEDTLRCKGPRKLDVRFLTGRGTLTEAQLAMTPLEGAHGSEGAIVIVTTTPQATSTSRSEREVDIEA